MPDTSQADQPGHAPLPQSRKSVALGDLKEVRQHRSFPTFRAISALFLREMQTSHARASGGYVWAIAEPIGGIIMLTLIFQVFLRTPPIGTNFPLFYATGIIPFMAYQDIASKVAASISYSRNLLQYPAVVFADALLARIIFSAMTQALVAILVLAGIVFLFETRSDPQIEGIALGMLMAVALGSAVGSMNCFLFSAFPWWTSVWSILTRPLFLLSGLFFIYDDVPIPYKDYLWWNPLIHVVGQMRRSFYPSYSGDYVSHLYVFSLSLSLFALGFALLKKYHRDIHYS